MTWPDPMLVLELSDLNVVGLLSKSFEMQYYGFFFAKSAQIWYDHMYSRVL